MNIEPGTTINGEVLVRLGSNGQIHTKITSKRSNIINEKNCMQKIQALIIKYITHLQGVKEKFVVVHMKHYA